MTASNAESNLEGLSPRERLLFDLLHTGVTAALCGGEKRASRIVENAWKSADRLQPSAAPLDDLHAAIMNLPCEPDSQSHGERQAFKRGHKQARHAAAALVPQS